MLGYIKDIIRNLRCRLLQLKLSGKPHIALPESVLIVAPHPDDEAIGCGGLIARLCAEGHAPHVVVMTGGGGSLRGYSDMPESEVIKARRNLTLNSAKALGLPESNIHFLDFVDGHIGDRPESEMNRIKELIEQLQPDAIFVPHSGEGWPDHLNTRNIVLNSKLLPLNSPSVYEYCVWMWYYNVWNLDWRNAFQLKMADAEHSAKLKAVDAYIKPLAPCGQAWSGVLPKPFIKANTARQELYFKLR